MKNSRSLGW